MKSINPDPLTPDQAIDILHRAAAAEGAPIFKDCADVIVSLEKLRTQNEALTKENLELSMVASAKIAKAAAAQEALKKEVERLRSEQLLDIHAICDERNTLRTQLAESHAKQNQMALDMIPTTIEGVKWEELKQENEELKSSVSFLMKEATQLTDERDQLRAQNRELSRVLKLLADENECYCINERRDACGYCQARKALAATEVKP